MTTFWMITLFVHALSAMDNPPVLPTACSLSVSTNPGETVCQLGEQVNLDAFISGNYSSVEWTPQIGIANPFSPNTTATINGDITYTVNVSGPDDVNLIVNGDFSAGVSGFTSDYVWPPTGGGFGPLSPEGQYAVTNNPNSQHTNFAACGDATGDGNMMVVNGAGTPNVNVWCQSIGVSPFTDYEFSAFLASVIGSSPAQLQFSINGLLLGTFSASSSVCNWQQFSQQWNSGGNSSATICIVNQNTATSGNDFALDGLSFAEVCTASADITFSVSECNATFFPFTDICINSFPFDLNSMLDPGATPGGVWTINGIPADFFEPGVWGVGLHQITYEVCDFPCPAIFSDFIVVEPLPDADWAAPPSVCESEPVINLNTWLLPGSMSGGIWTIDGVQSTTFNPAALGPGQHVIIYTVGDPPCNNSLTDVVEVTSLANPSWTPPPPLCEDDAPFSLFDLTNQETTPNGSWLINGVANNTFSPSILGAGSHVVTYQAGVVPCDDSETHTIIISPTPHTDWTAPPPVCQNSAAFDLNTLLDPGTATGGTWTINGNTSNIFDPAALTPGNQFIQYFFNTGDCPSIQEDVIVVQYAPEAAFTLSEDTICVGQTTLQTFTGQENGMAAFHYEFDGATVTGAGLNMRELSWDTPGTYQLSLWLEEGGCTSDTVFADVVVLPPLEAPVISCGDSTTSSLSFEWTDVPGATGYNVIIIGGPPMGTLNGNSITFDGLGSGESVSIQVSALADSPCPSALSEVATCTTLDCIPPTVEITPVDPICLFDSIAPFALEVALNPAGGMGFWEGPGIVDSLTGLFDPMLADTGIHTIRYIYDLNNCLSSSVIFIEIKPVPELHLTGADTICINDSIGVMLLDSLLPGTLLTWDFDGGISSDSVQSTTQTISWGSPGIKHITAVAELNACVSDTAYLNVLVEALLIAPNIQCESSTNSVLFFWNPVPQAASYAVLVNSGQSGVMSSDTSFLVTGLMAGESVSISLTVNSGNACPGITAEANCSSLLCPPVLLEIGQPEPNCFDGTPENIALSFSTDADTNLGTLAWSGGGIADPQSPTWTTDAAQVGQSNLLILTYTEGVCTYSDTAALQVFATPVASFELPNLICVQDEALLNFTGQTNGSATFTWDFGGAMATPATGIGPHSLKWSSPGTYTVALQLEENGCVALPFSESVQVDPLLSPPLIECEATTSSVLFFWNPVPQAASYAVLVNSGQSGMMSSDTSFLVTGLMAGESVSISLTVNSGNACPGITAEANCSSLLCPPVLLEIGQPEPNCFDGTPENIALSFSTDADTNLGTLAWSGGGIADPQSPTWTTDAAQVGQSNLLILTYTEGVCTYSDTAALQVFATPVASFELPNLICVQDEALLNFTGQTNGSATFTWDFGGAVAAPATGIGPHSLQWPSPGTYTVALQLEENGCVALPFSESVQVDPLLSPPLIECEATTSSVLFFWNPVPQAASYAVLVNSGQSGVMSSDTSFLVTGLMAGESVSIFLTVNSGNACPGILVEHTCTAALCPVVSVAILATEAICLGELAHLEIQFSGESSGPYDLVLSTNSINSFLEGIENVYSLDLPLTETTLFEILSISNAQAPGCTIQLPNSVQTIVSTPLSAGNGILPLSFCSRTDTLVLLSDLLLDADMGGVWTYVSGPALAPGALSGSFFSPEDQAPGLYQFSYEIAAAAPCPIDSATIMVEILERPYADAGEDQTFSCLFNEVTLGGDGTSIDPGIVYEWQSDEGHFSTAPNASLVEADAAGLYTLWVQNTSNGCQASDEVMVDSDISIPIAGFSILPITCFAANDGAIRIDSIQGGTAPYEVLFNGGVYNSSLLTMLGPGQYPVTIIDAAGCQSAYSFNLSEPDEMQVVLLALFPTEENELELGDSLLLEILVNRPEEEIEQVIWQPSGIGCDTCLSAVLHPQQSGLLSVEVIDLNGCSDGDQLQYFLRKDRNIYVPNIFSPNGDGANDLFLVFAGKEVRQILSFQVFSRWGEMVHERYHFMPNDPQFGWDGHYRGELMNGAVFVWYVEVELLDGKAVLLKGDVTLLR